MISKWKDNNNSYNDESPIYEANLEPIKWNSEMEKEMATHSNVLAWRIPGTGETGGLPSLGSHRVGHDWSDLAAAAAAAEMTVRSLGHH